MQLVIGNKNYSTWSLRAWLAGMLSGYDFSESMVDLGEPDYQDKLQAISGAARVPVLLVDDAIIWDSLAICEYFAELNPALWPQDPMERARARSMCAEMHSAYTTLRAKMPMNIRAGGRRIAPNEQLREEIRRVNRLWSRSIDLSKGPYLFGQSPTIADCFFAPVVSRFHTYQVLEGDHFSLNERSLAYANTILQWPLYQQWRDAALEEQSVVEQDEVGEPV